MALSPEIVYTFEDASGKESTASIKVAPSFSLSQYIEAGQQIAQFLDLLVHGRIKPIADFCLFVDLSFLGVNTASVDSDVEEIGYFEFQTTQGRSVEVSIPGIDEQYVVAGTNQLDQADPLVAAFITETIDGHVLAVAGGTVEPCDIGEDDIVGLLVAEERFRNSGSRA